MEKGLGFPIRGKNPMKKKYPFLFVLALTSLVSCGAQNSVAASSSSAKSSSAISSSSVAPSSSSSAYSSSQPVSSTSALKSKDITMYVETDNGVENQKVTVYFLNGYSEVPFVCLNNASAMMERIMSDSVVTANSQQITLGRTENTGKILFDFANQRVNYTKYDLFFAGHDTQSDLNLISTFGTTGEGAPKYLRSCTNDGLDYNRYGNDMTLDLKKYKIPMYYEDGKGYVPLQTLSDTVFAGRNVICDSNGVALFMTGAELYAKSEMVSTFYQADKGNRSEEMAQFSRDEFAMLMDIQYGLKEDHRISDFDTFLTQTGRNEGLLSTDPLVADTTMQKFITADLADFHSALRMTSAYAGSDALAAIKADKTIPSPNYDEYQLIRYAFPTARKAIYQALYKKDQPDSYEEYGDTAYVTFDSFRNPSVDYYTTTPTSAATDTFGIVAYAHSQIFRENSPVKNVVLDLSCNGGGAINAGIYVAGWFLPYGILDIRNTWTESCGAYSYQSDTNLDGKYDATDRLSTKNLYCITSPASFSCANSVASIFKDSDQVRLLGRRTSGGACIVQHATLADGTSFQTSGNRRLCGMRNGAFSSIEGGIDVDFSLDSYMSFYNRTALTSKIDAL